MLKWKKSPARTGGKEQPRITLKVGTFPKEARDVLSADTGIRQAGGVSSRPSTYS